MTDPHLRPATVSTVVAGHLLALVPPSGFNAYRAAHPGEFPNSTPRRIALIDLDRNPRRQGLPVTVDELLAADRAEDGNRERYRGYNEQRKSVTSANVTDKPATAPGDA